MTIHPGHPLLAVGDKTSASRQVINDALLTVKTTTQTTDQTPIDPLTHGTHVLCDATSGVLTMSLPDFTADAAAVDLRLVFKKIDATGNAVTIDTVGAPTIDGAASTSLAAQWDGVTVWNDGSQWYIEE